MPTVKSDASGLYFHFDPQHKRAEGCWKLDDWEEYHWRQSESTYLKSYFKIQRVMFFQM